MDSRSDTTGEGESAFRKVRGALIWAAAGAALGFAVVGLFGVLCGFFCWLLHGDAGHALSLGVSCAITGAAAGAVTGAVGRLIDGENPFAREEPPPESVGSVVVHVARPIVHSARSHTTNSEARSR